MTSLILFLPGTGIPDEFYEPFLKVLSKYGKVHHWRYKHDESIHSVCKRLGGNVELFGKLREEVCFGANTNTKGYLGINRKESITETYERIYAGITADQIWCRTIVVGHSQGAGHALLLSQRRCLRGAVIVGGPADGLDGRIAPWTQGAYKTSRSRRLMLVHSQDAGKNAVLEHATASGMKLRRSIDQVQGNREGVVLLDNETVGAFAAHSCLASGQTWGCNNKRSMKYEELLKRRINVWEETGN